jgi:hypothetical protein
LAQLRSIANDVEIFTNTIQCVDFLTEIKSENAFMVVGGTIGERVVPLIHEIPQLDTIYRLLVKVDDYSFFMTMGEKKYYYRCSFDSITMTHISASLTKRKRKERETLFISVTTIRSSQVGAVSRQV